MPNESSAGATTTTSGASALLADANTGWFLCLVGALVVLLSLCLLLVTGRSTRRWYHRYVNSGTALTTTPVPAESSNHPSSIVVLRVFGASEGSSIRMATKTTFKGNSSGNKNQQQEEEGEGKGAAVDEHEGSSGWSSCSEHSSTTSVSDDDIEDNPGILNHDIEARHQGTMATWEEQNLQQKTSSQHNQSFKAVTMHSTIPATTTTIAAATTTTTTTTTTTASSAIAIDNSYKVKTGSFGALARRILSDGDKVSRNFSQHHLPDIGDDVESVYSGSTLSIFGGSSVASDDNDARQRGWGSSQSLPPPVVPDAVADWFAFKLEAGLSEEDDSEHPQRLSVLVGKTLRPVRLHL